MSELATVLRDQRKIDAGHLKILAICHFVGVGLALIGILFLIGHYAIMHMVFTNPKFWQGQNQAPPPAEIFAIMKWFYLIGGLWFVASGILNFISAFCLLTRKHRVFSLVVAGINCLHVPLGTILGVFTIVILVRESVRELYEAQHRGVPE